MDDNTQKTLYDQLLSLINVVIKPGSALLKTPVEVKPLSAADAIGSPGDWDYPLLRGKEVLLQARLKNSPGQAFTSTPTDFAGTPEEAFALDLSANKNRAIFIAVLNALLHELGLIEKTVHCRNEEPVKCGMQIAAELERRYGRVRLGIAGYQPALINACADQFGAEMVFVTDLGADNLGKTISGIEIRDAVKKTPDLIDNSDLLLVTGSVFVNNTAEPFIEAQKSSKPVVFYGTTAVGAARLMGLTHLCPLAH